MRSIDEAEERERRRQEYLTSTRVAALVARKPDPDVVDLLRNALERAESGALFDVVVVGDLQGEGCFFSHAKFADRWRLLGALEYAKNAVHLST